MGVRLLFLFAPCDLKPQKVLFLRQIRRKMKKGLLFLIICFYKIFNMTSQLHNSLVMGSVQIIDTLIYQGTFQDWSLTYGQSTALGLFKSVVGFVLVITTDRIAKLCGERGII